MTKRFWTVLLSLGLAVSCFEIAVSLLARRRADADNASLNEKLAQQREAMARARKSAADAQRLLAELPVDPPALEVPPPATDAPAPPTPPADDGLILTHHPALRAKFEQSIRADLHDRYSPLFQRWQLSGDKVEKLLGLMIRDAESALDLQGAAAARGLDLDAPEGTNLRTRQFAELLAAEQALLAPEQYQALQQFQRMDGVRPAIAEIASAALFSGPLTSAQADQLAQVMAECSPEYQAGGRAQSDTVNWDDALPRVAAFLPEAQFACVRTYAHFVQRFQRLGKIFDPAVSPPASHAPAPPSPAPARSP